MPSARLLLGILGIFLPAALAGAPVESISSVDYKRMQSVVSSAKMGDGTFGGVMESYFGTSAQQLLGLKPATSSLCKKIEKLVSDESVSDIFYATEAGCKLKLTSERMTTLQTALDTGVIADAYMAASALKAAGSLAKASLKALKESLEELKQDDNTYRASFSAGRADAASTAYALKLNGIIGSRASKSTKGLLALAKSVGDDMYFISPGRNRLVTTALVLETVVELGDVTKEQVDMMASFLVNSKYVRSVEDIHSLLKSLSICADNKISVPLVLAVTDSVVSVTDILGGKAPKTTVTLVKAVDRLTKKADAAAKGKTIKNGKLPSDLSPGMYDMQFKVEPASSSGVYSAQTTTRLVRIAADVKPKSAVIYVGKSTKFSGDEEKHTAKFPKEISAEKIVTDEASYVLLFKLALEGASTVKPEQVFLQFTSPDTGKTSVFVMAAQEKYYSTKINMGSLDFRERGLEPGLYSVGVIVGGALLKESVSWKLGDVEITWPAATGAKSKADAMLAPKAEISHIFPPAEKTPNVLISLVFTVICLTPLAIIVYGIELVGIKLVLPSGSGALWAYAFQVALICIVFLNVMYFLVLNTFEALGCLAALSVPTVVFGVKTLNDHSRQNEKKKME